MQPSGLGAVVRLVIARDLRLAVRHWDHVVQPLIFFAIITTLFPLAISPAGNAVVAARDETSAPA